MINMRGHTNTSDIFFFLLPSIMYVFVPSSGLHATLMTTLPTCFWDSRYAYASIALSNGKTLSTTGLVTSGFALIKLFISSNLDKRIISQDHSFFKLKNCWLARTEQRSQSRSHVV